MLLRRASQPLFWGLLAVGTFSGGMAIAQEPVEKAAPLKQFSIPETVDQTAKINTFWKETGIVQDAKSFFVVSRDEQRIQNRSKNFESLYLELLEQQYGRSPLMRTQDAVNPFDTSLREMQN